MLRDKNVDATKTAPDVKHRMALSRESRKHAGKNISQTRFVSLLPFREVMPVIGHLAVLDHKILEMLGLYDHGVKIQSL